MRRFQHVMWAVVLLVQMGCASAPPSYEKALREGVSPLVDPALPVEKRYLGVAAGVVTEKGMKFLGLGRSTWKKDGPPEIDTVFEIGSITKVFTALLLADAIELGFAKLDDPLGKFFDRRQNPMYERRAITLVDLATHTSGLPRLPSNFYPIDLSNPYNDYNENLLTDFLLTFKLDREPGLVYEYSNLGSGLLGWIIAKKIHHAKFEDVVVKRISERLGLLDTRVHLKKEQRPRVAEGHNEKTRPVLPWEVGDKAVLSGAVALRSTPKDLLKFLAANAGIGDNNPLRTAMEMTHQPRTQLPGQPGRSPTKVALGWHYFDDSQVYWHNGGTYGFSGFVAFSKQYKIGVVVLANSFLLNESGDEMDPRLVAAGMKILSSIKNN